MPLDESFVGRSYPPSAPYRVSREKIREFADAIGDGNPLCRDVTAARAAGHADVVAPPTFPTIINLKAIEDIVADPQLGLDWSRVVHGEQGFHYRRPITAGDTLVLVATIAKIMARAGNDFLTVRVDISTESGEHVVESNALLVARGAE
ncbi:MAG TPA: MaoC family dehydratase N-terminal domain-containing protein [Pseudonocardiaceae bacterium]|jgi:acyl dehydratase|nr:MaoC family dehydratase N-terminal domain-containing protein [Pseudonocardiaceae bacterium]